MSWGYAHENVTREDRAEIYDVLAKKAFGTGVYATDEERDKAINESGKWAKVAADIRATERLFTRSVGDRVA